MYLPIVIVIVYSFNVSKQSSIWAGWTLGWYKEVFKDRSLIEALKNSLILGDISSGIAGVIGTLGAVGMAKAHFKSKGIIEYISTIPIMIPEIILGMVFMVYLSLLKLPLVWLTIGMLLLYSLCIYDG